MAIDTRQLDSKPPRPVLRYHGGKYRLADWIVSHFPAHKVYTESYGGAASVLMHKPRSYAEVYNDLDGEVVSLFRVLRDRESAAELERQLRMTPFARDEFVLSYQPTKDELELARRTIVRSFMGFGSASASGQDTGFRANSNRSHTTPAHDWMKYPDALAFFIARLQGVVIENRPAVEVIKHHDAPHALHYVDPPYPHGTRSQKRGNSPAYRFEMTDSEHIELADVLRSVEGMVIISGYACDMYDRELYSGWHRVERSALADGAKPRTEVLWLNDVTAMAQAQGRLPL